MQGIYIYREVVKFQDSPYPIQIPARGFDPKIGKILGLFIEQTQGQNECSMKSPSISPILGSKTGGNLNWIGGILKLYDLTVLCAVMQYNQKIENNRQRGQVLR